MLDENDLRPFGAGRIASAAVIEGNISQPFRVSSREKHARGEVCQPHESARLAAHLFRHNHLLPNATTQFSGFSPSSAAVLLFSFSAACFAPACSSAVST